MRKTIRITKTFGFEMAHALKDHEGPCRNIHGHSYKLQVTVIGSVSIVNTQPMNGMVMDFTQLKKIVFSKIIELFDHALMLENTSPYLDQVLGKEPIGKLQIVDYTPTCENILINIASTLQHCLPDEVRLHHIRLSETTTSFAEWYEEDNLN
jgi:6-pyruvoyltetrahydropterin/6-carboxytetrahydropterin synthase